MAELITVELCGARVRAEISGRHTGDAADWRIFWLHGWGQSRASLVPTARFFDATAQNFLVDLPGFGASPPPPEGWGTSEYAAVLGTWLSRLSPARTLLVGHSFGARVAIQAAARHPDQVHALVLLAAPGLKTRRPLAFRLRAAMLRTISHTLATVDRLAGTATKARFSRRFGSRDYREAGIMRPVLVRAVNEDLSAVACSLKQPVLLIYGADDTETPASLGARFAELMPRARFVALKGQDHYSILSAGRHQVQTLIADFLSNGPGTA